MARKGKFFCGKGEGRFGVVRGGAQGRVVETGPKRMGKPAGEGLAGKGREMAREVVFSEPGWYGRTNAETLRSHWCDYDKPAAERTNAPVKPKPSTRACGARPSEGGHPGQNGLAGKGRK